MCRRRLLCKAHSRQLRSMFSSCLVYLSWNESDTQIEGGGEGYLSNYLLIFSRRNGGWPRACPGFAEAPSEVEGEAEGFAPVVGR